MQIHETRDALDKALAPLRQAGQRIGLVPTMGNLHAGHLALVEAAKADCDHVLATIFVNPLQFGPAEDLDAYPKTPREDIQKLEQAGCHSVFIPATSEMYPTGLENQTLVTVPGLSERHCGASRPGHFAGVCTIVSKLFNMTQPDKAYFGEKDFQQLQVIRKMATDLCMPLEVIGVPIARNDKGLALSSRNSYLSASELEKAPELQRQLRQAAQAIAQGATNFNNLQEEATAALNSSGFDTDYFTVCHAQTLEPAEPSDTDLVILAAAWLGKTRLIDNIRIRPDP